jgi:hypothetical protein
MRRIPNVSELLVWYEIECIGKMQAQRGGPFEITWELLEQISMSYQTSNLLVNLIFESH